MAVTKLGRLLRDMLPNNLKINKPKCAKQGNKGLRVIITDMETDDRLMTIHIADTTKLPFITHEEIKDVINVVTQKTNDNF